MVTNGDSPNISVDAEPALTCSLNLSSPSVVKSSAAVKVSEAVPPVILNDPSKGVIAVKSSPVIDDPMSSYNV